jgi:hypothetical protein
MIDCGVALTASCLKFPGNLLRNARAGTHPPVAFISHDSDAQVHVIDAGHFALDEAADIVADLTGKFLDTTTNG